MASEVANISSTAPATSASRTACAPSARKRPASRRADRLVRRRAAASRVFELPSNQAAGDWAAAPPMPSAATAARATSTSAVNAAGSMLCAMFSAS